MRTVTIMILAAMLLFAGPARSKEGAKKTNFVEDFLANVTLGKGVLEEQLVIFPLIAKEKPKPLSISSDLGASKLHFSEPEWPEKRYNVDVQNAEKVPVLLFGGNVILGGKLDRMIEKDVLLPPGAEIELPMLPAQYPKERRKEAVPFKSAQALAPVYIRDRAVFDPSRYLVPIFISHFLEFRNAGDARHSLQAIDESEVLAQFCLVCQRAVAQFPDVGDSNVVGFITAVRGRVQSVELFATNRLLRAYFQPIIRAHTYAAAAVQLRAKKVGLPIPGRDDKDATLKATTQQAEKLMAELRKARYRRRNVPRNAVGETLLLRTPHSDGSAIGLDGRLVHAVIFQENPLEEALYSRALKLPPELSGSEEGFGELERRSGRGNLSEYEKRLLDRMRQRRQGPAGGGFRK